MSGPRDEMIRNRKKEREAEENRRLHRERAALALKQELEKLQVEEERKQKEAALALKQKIEKLRIEEERKQRELKQKEHDRQKAIAVLIASMMGSFEARWRSFITLAEDRFSLLVLEEKFQKIQQMGETAEENLALEKAIAALEGEMANHLNMVSTFAQAEVEARSISANLKACKAVHTFCNELEPQWDVRHKLILSKVQLRQVAPEQSTADLRVLIEEGNNLIEQALKHEAESESRFSLLQATIESLKSIGFSSLDPVFEDESNPLSAVVLTAMRGSEKIYLSVPLGGVVHSKFGGFPGETCAETFEKYLEKLKEKGFECEPTNPGLRDEPKLIGKNAKELPRNNSQQRNV